MGYNQINLNHLRMFIIAAESNSLQEVAKKTGYEVSNVSTNIKTFEQEVGTKLFTRNPLTLTEIGEEIYEKAQKAYRELEFATSIAGKRTDIRYGRLSIGCPSHIANYYLADIINNAIKDYKNLEIDLDCESPCKVMLEKIKNNKLQFALLDFIPVENDRNDFAVKKIKSSKYIFVANQPIEIKNISQLNDYKYIISDDDYKSSAVEFIEYLKQYNVNIKPRIRCKTTEMRVLFAKLGLGIAYVIKDAVRHELENKNLYEVKLPNTIIFPDSNINIVYIKDRLTKVDREFINKYLLKKD